MDAVSTYQHVATLFCLAAVGQRESCGHTINILDEIVQPMSLPEAGGW
jgi:hypothetical protein